MRTTNSAETVLNLLAALTIAAGCVRDDGHDADDLIDARDCVAFWWEATPGITTAYQPDGRALVRL